MEGWGECELDGNQAFIDLADIHRPSAMGQPSRRRADGEWGQRTHLWFQVKKILGRDEAGRGLENRGTGWWRKASRKK